MIATQILATVEAGRLQKAVEGLVSGAYTITVASQSETEIRGFVANGDGKEYGVVLSKEGAFCSCKDAMYRKGICKHAVVLSLYTIRNPKGETTALETAAEPAAPPFNLKLGKVRRGFAFSA
jgi:hypothetical protein